MSDVVIRAEGLGKKFRIGSKQPYHRLSEVISSLGSSALRGLRPWRSRSLSNTSDNSSEGTNQEPNPEEFWALRDLNFEIRQGEVVGIIGRNGAGKSTLLKILSRITEPTEGRFGLKGRVGSLLEVGTGFHQELTGRENIFLSGNILGMTRTEIKNKFDEIVAFSGVEKFLDTPVKRYSSGMQVRLGFAVAAHLDPEILIVDEVLAVGDAEFQKKCLGKMGDVAQSGRTILFVSHNMGSIRNVCKSGLMLNNGKMLSQGDITEVINKYRTSQEDVSNAIATFPDSINQDHQILEFAVINEAESESPCGLFRTTDNITFRIRLKCLGELSNSFLLVFVSTVLSETIVVLDSRDSKSQRTGEINFDNGYMEFRVNLKGPLLKEATYLAGVEYRSAGGLVESHHPALSFDIIDEYSIKRERQGFLAPYPEWRQRPLESNLLLHHQELRTTLDGKY